MSTSQHLWPEVDRMHDFLNQQNTIGKRGDPCHCLPFPKEGGSMGNNSGRKTETAAVNTGENTTSYTLLPNICDCDCDCDCDSSRPLPLV